MRALIPVGLLLASCAEQLPDPVFTAVADIPATDGADAVSVDAPSVDAPEATGAEASVAPDRPATVDVPVVTVDVESELSDVPPGFDLGVDVPGAPDVPVAPDVPAMPCERPLMVCSGACVDLQRDAAHCGTCGRACLSDERCNAGRCEGPTGYRVVRDDPGAAWSDACAAAGHQTVLMDVDDGSFRATLPFRFRYWGVVVAEGAPVTVTPNGYLTFQDPAPTPANGIIPNHLDGVDAVIAAQWRDLRTRSPGLCLAVTGNAPSRRWIAQWNDARYYTSGLSHLTFQIALNESSNAVDMAHGSMTLPEPSTVALENWDGTRSSIPYDIPQPITFANRRVRFVPQ